MATQPLHHYSLEEYFDFDNNSEMPHEYISGEIVPAFDGTPAHGIIGGNAYFELRTRLKNSPCKAYTGLRIVLSLKKNYAYPHALVACGTLEYLDAKKETITNAKLVVEVLSRTTKDYDLGRKLRLYWDLPSVTEVVLIDQESVWIEYWTRATDGEWKKLILKSANDLLRIESLGCEIPLSALYDGVEF